MDEENRISNRDDAKPAPKIGLVKVSLLLAVFLEVIPVEGDAIYVMLASGQVVRAVVFKLLCLTLIFLPLIVYVYRNGLGAVKVVKGRVVVVCLITLVNLAGFFVMVYGYVFAQPPG